MITAEEEALIQREAVLAEKQGRMTEAQLQLIYEKAWFKLLVPKTIGGKETNPVEFARFIEELATIDGSFAWVVNLGAGANMFAGFLNADTAREIFSPQKTCVAGSGAVGGAATKRNDGYVIEGHWKYASGAAHANFFSLNAQVTDEGNAVRSFLVPASKVKILDTWKVSGLKASASCDFIVKEVWVPENYLFDLQKPVVCNGLYRFPFLQMAEMNMLVMVTGMAMHFRKMLVSIVETKEFDQRKISDAAGFHASLAKTSDDLFKKRKDAFSLYEGLWEKVILREKISASEEYEFRNIVLTTATSARQLVDELCPFAGMNLIFENAEINRTWRDFKVASQHALLSPLRLVV